MLKVKPLEDYPPEPGCYLRGNDYSPVAVVVLLNAHYTRLPSDISTIPKEIEKLTRVAVETGAAIAGTLQTENIGIEKIVANIASNPNIRYVVLCGKEVEGHNSGGALKALIQNGVDDKKTIVGAKAATPYLFNIPLEAIERFRNQITLVDLLGEEGHEVVAKAVWSCYQENSTQFRNYSLRDPGAYCESAKSFSLTMRVPHPEEVEKWELDEVVQKLEAEEKVKEKGVQVTKAKTREEIPEGMSEDKSIAIGKHLAKIAEELSAIARILTGEELVVERREQGALEVAAKPRVALEELLSEEGEKAIIFFENQLRAYNSIFAAFRALKNDICGRGLNLPIAVNSAIKKLTKLKEELEQTPLPIHKKEENRLRIAAFLREAEELPTDPGPCEKTAGNCKIGKGCFATCALDMLKLITEPTLL